MKILWKSEGLGMVRKMRGDVRSRWKNPGRCMTTISFSKTNVGSWIRATEVAAETSESRPRGMMSQAIISGRNWTQNGAQDIA